MSDPFGPKVKFTFGRGKGTAKREFKKGSVAKSVGSRASAGSRGSKASSSGSGGYVVLSEATGDHMVRWWTSQVAEYDHKIGELQARCDQLSQLHESVVTQLQHAQGCLAVASKAVAAAPSVAAVTAAAAAPAVAAAPAASFKSERVVRLERELAERDETISRLTLELHKEAKAHAELKILMLQHVF